MEKVQSDAYFPEWKAALTIHIHTFIIDDRISTTRAVSIASNACIQPRLNGNIP